MLYLTDTLPKFCPNCGKKHSADWADANEGDFSAGASLQCACGALFQFVPSEQMVEASKLNQYGDLHRYAKV